MKQKKVFLINGPAGSGKDALANYLHRRHIETRRDKFAKPLKEANALLYGFDIDDLYRADSELYRWDNDKKEKETTRAELGGRSWRQVNINLSELYVKRFGGQSFFGQSFVNRAKRMEIWAPKIQSYVISDSGFTDEAKPVVDYFGKDNVACIQIFADGYDFEGDSRSYIDYTSLGIECKKILNDFTPNFFIEAEKFFLDKING